MSVPRVPSSGQPAPPSASSPSTQPSPSSTPPSTPTPPTLPWLAWTVGQRVVVRYRLFDGLHDALGEVVDTAPDHVTIDTRHGKVRVEATTMVTGKPVPPRRW